MKDDLGDRMKGNYEDRTRHLLPRRTYTIARLDGKAFHTYTRNLKKPFDNDLFEDIDAAIIAMLPEIQGAVFAYTQSDEISILLTDFATPNTSAWFDGNLQKMCSVSASIMTAEFNRLRLIGWLKGKRYKSTIMPRMFTTADDIPVAYFDSRIFTIPDRIEVMNYFIWRNQDCSRNSVAMVAQSLYSHKELMGKNISEQQEMIHNKGKSWVNDYSMGEKNGRLIVKESYRTDNLCGEVNLKDGLPSDPIMRTRWVSKGAWKFTEDKTKLLGMIPEYE